MKKSNQPKHSLEILEHRIAPAAIPLTANWIQGSLSTEGSPIVLRAGMGLSTSGENGGDYLLYIEKGTAWVYTTDFNNNDQLDFNEITGIAAGDGLRMIALVDIRGDIVTNLKETVTGNGVTYSLSDSNNNPADDSDANRGDGRVVLNNRIELIELRTLTTADIVDQDGNGLVNARDVDLRRAPSTHSIFGNIYAGGGFGIPGDPTSGLLIDSTVTTNFGFEDSVKPTIGSIRVGTAVSGEYFSFGIRGGYETTGGVLQQRIRVGVVLGDDAQGYLAPFIPSPGQPGASISFIRSAGEDQPYNLNGLYAGDGGSGAPGGNISDVTINGDDAGGYNVIAGNGGNGARGGLGGSILRFSDLNSDTSKVIIRSGDGGNGGTGAGGNGGETDIIAANFYGNYSIIEGNGGDGFTQGGNGASLAKATITMPVPAGVNSGTAWGTSHNPSYENLDPTVDTDPNTQLKKYDPHLGMANAFDIDGDGFGDYVYSTIDTSQIVVLFGDAFGGFRSTITPEGLIESDRIYLASPRNAEALTVADLNGDGRPDIAAGSSDAGNQAGISVFIANWEDVNKDGDVMDLQDRFVGYYDPRFSPLPQLDDVDAFWPGPQQIGEIVAGDFDGDGTNELAVLTRYASRATFTDEGIITALTQFAGTVVFMSPDRELDTNTGKVFLTGQFYADFGTKLIVSEEGTAPAAPRTPYIEVGALDSVIMEATALTTDATHDVLIVGTQGGSSGNRIRTIEYFNQDVAPSVIGTWNIGGIDTNRNVAQGENPNTNSQAIGMLDFGVLDLDADGNVDLIVLSQSPANYVVGVLGNGLGAGVQDSGGPVSNNVQDQAGLFFNSEDWGTPVGIKAVDSDGDGIVDDFAVLFDDPPGPVNFMVSMFDYAPGANFPGLSGPEFVTNLLTYSPPPAGSVANYRGGGVTDGVMWDFHYATMDFALPDVGVGADNLSFIIGGFFIEPKAEPGLNIIAGDGGDAFVGRGGTGGFIGGQGSLETVVIDPINNVTVTEFVGDMSITFDGSILLEAGNGGLGFSKGGNGGSITGVTVRDSPSLPFPIVPVTSIIAGDGGRGISGTGGSGGDLINNSVYNGFLFFAGDGGAGKIGGRGGNVIGNGNSIGTTRVYDTITPILEVFAGAGGNGMKAGGAGGSILNLRPIMNAIAGGSLSYVAGSGGNAISGVGGVGGSIVNSSPELNAVLENEIYLEAGRGGNGTTGGGGGSISTFAVTQLDNEPVALVSMIAGHGGNGTTGSGGRGGNITAVDAKSGGFGPSLTGFSYSRFLAGNGGTSFGARGGEGGTISNVITSASLGTIAIVSGAGGDGLTQGGVGGSVLNVVLSALGAASTSKALVVAGAGGDARAFIPNPLDNTPDQEKKAFGGRVGVGGNGGSINGFRQFGDNSAHADLIAGDGGSTIHYGTGRDPKPFVGRGGSVLNVTLEGNAGNINPLTAIRSYNDVFTGESMADFVERRIRVGESAVETLTDLDGNVGIVVGAAGRIKAVVLDPIGAPYEYTSLPAKNARNGDLVNLRVNTLMSAVAGNVERIAAIQLGQNIFVNGTFVGTDKGVIGTKEWYDPDGVIQDEPKPDGALLDGALIALKLINAPTFGNIFPGL